MPNPFKALGGNGNAPFGNMNAFMQKFNQFKSTFQGDPQQKVQEMLNNGTVSQEQVNQAMQIAKQIRQFIPK